MARVRAAVSATPKQDGTEWTMSEIENINAIKRDAYDITRSCCGDRRSSCFSVSYYTMMSFELNPTKLGPRREMSTAQSKLAADRYSPPRTRRCEQRALLSYFVDRCDPSVAGLDRDDRSDPRIDNRPFTASAALSSPSAILTTVWSLRERRYTWLIRHFASVLFPHHGNGNLFPSW
jgi:hypothetical protein